MDKFVPKSMDEFDDIFFNKKESDTQQDSISSGRDSLIPDISVESKSSENFLNSLFDETSPAPAEEKPAVEENPFASKKPATVGIQDSIPVTAPAAESAGNSPIDVYNQISSSSPKTVKYVEYDYDDTDEVKASKPGKGLTFAKVIVMILLVGTVLTFVMGCFVSLFSDNDLAAAGYSFCTMSTDVKTPSLSKGDMLIVKKVPSDKLQVKNLIAFRSMEFGGYRVHVISGITPSEDGTLIFTTAGYDGDMTNSATISDVNIVGVVKAYVPNLGTVMNFAGNNGILLCTLFGLLVLFWGLILILIERNRKKR